MSRSGMLPGNAATEVVRVRPSSARVMAKPTNSGGGDEMPTSQMRRRPGARQITPGAGDAVPEVPVGNHDARHRIGTESEEGTRLNQARNARAARTARGAEILGRTRSHSRGETARRQGIM